MTIYKRGSKGNDVKRIQERLIALGYDLGPHGADGDFGESTERAVVEWETDTHVSGSIDADEMQLLFAGSEQRESTDIPNGFDELVERYGRPWENVDEWWKKWCAGANIGLAFGHVIRPRKVGGVLGCWIWVNRDIVDDIESIFKQIADEGLAADVKTYDGCFNVRRIRGSKEHYSTHSWAIAIDLNAATNGLNVDGDMNPRIIEIFRAHGWVCGADFKRKDFMHFQRVTNY